MKSCGSRGVKGQNPRAGGDWPGAPYPALFGGIVPRKASAHLRDLLTQTEALMLSDVSAQTAIYSPQTATAKLALTEFLVTRGWRIPGCESAGQNRRIFQTFCRYPSFSPCR
jgi:hypothetical protein